MSKIILAISTIVLLSNGCAHQLNKSANPDLKVWENLLDKNHIDKWNIKVRGEEYNLNYLNTFRISDSMIDVSYDNYKIFDQKFGHIFYADSLSYYTLRFEYFIYGEHLKDAPGYTAYNSGLMIHSQPAASMTFNQGFPMSLEMQLLANGGEIENNYTGNLCTPGTQVYMNNKLRVEHCINSSSEKYPAGKWVQASVDVFGDSLISHSIEGREVLSYKNPILKYESAFISSTAKDSRDGLRDTLYWIEMDKMPLKGGYVAFQAESQNIKFRNIQLLNLCGCMDTKAKNYKSYYIKPNNTTCLY